jgi:hypothetical protein
MKRLRRVWSTKNLGSPRHDPHDENPDDDSTLMRRLVRRVRSTKNLDPTRYAPRHENPDDDNTQNDNEDGASKWESELVSISDADEDLHQEQRVCSTIQSWNNLCYTHKRLKADKHLAYHAQKYAELGNCIDLLWVGALHSW